MADKSVKALLEFLDWTAEKGLMSKNAVKGRRGAVSNIFGVLDPEEKEDVSQIDLEYAMTRFINLEGKKYNPSSLNVYKSRVNAAVNDFLSWVNDPMSFKPQSSRGDKKNTSKAKVKKQEGTKKTDVVETKVSVSPLTPTARPDSASVFPIPIRENLVVRIHGLPFDLSTIEAEKIAAVVRAMAMKD